MKAFQPVAGATVTLAASTSSARVQLGGLPRTGRFQVRIHNAGPATAFVRRGDGAVTAGLGDIPMPSGAVEVLTMDNTDASPVTHLAAITASGTATLYATTGDGL